MWYPNFVLTGGSVYVGFVTDEMGKANAASWKGPTMDPRVIQPRSPPDRALSSLYVAATSGNFCPAFNFSRASKIFDCFSHKMCRTLTAVPPFFSLLEDSKFKKFP